MKDSLGLCHSRGSPQSAYNDIKPSLQLLRRLGRLLRQSHDEGRSFSGGAPGGDCSLVAFDDLLADGEADAGPRILLSSMEALEGLENLV